MNKNLTELIFVLDRSGSMAGLEEDTIGGYNGYIRNQIEQPGYAMVTTVLFDDKYDMIHDNVCIDNVAPMTHNEYFARGMTGLLDAIGRTITHVNTRRKYARDWEIPAKTLMVIITDGHENTSREYSLREVKSMINAQKEKHGWEFMFLGANIDAISTAANFGIDADRAVTYKADSHGTRLNFEAVSAATACYRQCMPISEDWKKDIEDWNR